MLELLITILLLFLQYFVIVALFQSRSVETTLKYFPGREKCDNSLNQLLSYLMDELDVLNLYLLILLQFSVRDMWIGLLLLEE